VADGDTTAQGVSLRRRFLSSQTAISFVALGGLLFLLTRSFDIAWDDTWARMRDVNPWWYGLAVVVHYTTFIFRGARWRLLLINVAKDDDPPPKPPSTAYCGRVILMSWFANSVTFFRMGDAFRAYAYAGDSKTSFPRAAGTVLADRLVDMTIVAGLMIVGLAMLLVRGNIDPPLLLVVVVAALMGLIVAGLAVMTTARRWVAPRLPNRVGAVYHRFHEGTMGSFGRLHLVFGLGVLGWLAEVGRLFFVVQALSVPVSLGLVVFVPMANGLMSAVPLTPGGLGVVETGVSGLLQLDLSVELALAVALVDRTISYLSIIVTGGIAFAFRVFFARAKTAAAPGVASSGE
jgi:uncharacterized protein (TIRG00374 family)